MLVADDPRVTVVCRAFMLPPCLADRMITRYGGSPEWIGHLHASAPATFSHYRYAIDVAGVATVCCSATFDATKDARPVVRQLARRDRRATHLYGTALASTSVRERFVHIGVPLLQGRVAPRCTNADSVLVVDVASDGTVASRVVDLPVAAPEELLELAHAYRISTFVCDGITRESRALLVAHGLKVVDNVVGSAAEVVHAVATGTLRPGLVHHVSGPEPTRARGRVARIRGAI